MQLRKKTFSIALVTFLLLPFQNCAGGFETSTVDLSSLGSEVIDEPAPAEPPPVTPPPTMPPPPAEPPPTTPPPPVTPPPVEPPVTPPPTEPPPVSTTMRKVFFASGHVGRTLLSCDGGRSWIRDRSDNDQTRCWVNGDPNNVECDHTPGSGRGIDAGDGWLFANFGWGQPGTVRRSRNGVNWETIRSGANGGGIGYVNGTLLSYWGNWSLSNNMGQTWTQVPNSPAPSMSHPLGYRLDDLFMALGRTQGLRISRDRGQSFENIASFPFFDGGYFTSGNGILVGVGGAGVVASSRDHGRTWTSRQVSTSARWSGVQFNGTYFVGWLGSQMWRSSDGQSWSVVGSLNVPNFSGPIAYNSETRTYATIPNNWGQYYSGQRAYVSTDGVSWTQLTGSAFRGGHPITHLMTADIEASHCP